MRGSDSVTRELRKNGEDNGKGGGNGPKEQLWSCEAVSDFLSDPPCDTNAGTKNDITGETGDDCKACCECDDNVGGVIVDTGFCTSTKNGCLELLDNSTCSDACNWVPPTRERKLPKKGGGSQGNGGGAGAKTQLWSCEAVNADNFPDITKGDTDFDCPKKGGKQYNAGKDVDGDTCQPCCLCGELPITGVCSREGACSGVPRLDNSTCTEACNYTP